MDTDRTRIIMSSPPKEISQGPLFIHALRSVTEAAARASYDWIGRGERGHSGRIAVEAMCRELDQLPISGNVIFGESDITGGLCTGTRINGGLDAPSFDIAVDPVEGTSYLARGMTNAMAVIGLCPEGHMLDPGPAFYMEKFAAVPAAKGKIDLEAPVEVKLNQLAQILGKPVSELNVFVLEKPRHRELVARLHKAGVRVALYPAGDVAGALMACIPESGIDALMGTGGVREGLVSACAIRALGGEFSTRFDPQLATEKSEMAKAGIDTHVWRSVDELVTSEKTYFCATGITSGLLFDGVERTQHHEKTQTLMIAGPNGERQILTTFHRLGEPAIN